MNFKFVACLLMVLLFVGIAFIAGNGPSLFQSRAAQQTVKTEERLKVSVCELKKDPGFYNHKLVEVTSFVSQGFENFSLFDPSCSDWPNVWLEYGGTAKSGTMYCCGVTSARVRPEPLVVENIPVSLVVDERFQHFDKLVHRPPDSVVRATVAGRFFSGTKIQYPSREGWGGFGHMGCCSLLAIEQIVSVEPHTSTDLDYGYDTDQPDLEKLGCSNYRFLTELLEFENMLKAQATADAATTNDSAQAPAASAQPHWSFTDPQRVATERLATLLNRDPNSVELKQSSKRQGRIIYSWHRRGQSERYMVVVSRPYWLSFYAKDPAKVAWVVISAFKACS